MSFSSAQRGVFKGIALGAAVTLAVFAAIALWEPTLSTANGDIVSRLVLATKSAIVLAVCLAACIGMLARHRFFTPADIDGGGLTSATDRAKVLQAMLQNTLEQVVLAAAAYLVWAVVAPVGWLAQIPVAAVLFGLGRILFWRGYAGGAQARALGFALTFYPSVLMIGVAVILALADLV